MEKKKGKLNLKTKSKGSNKYSAIYAIYASNKNIGFFIFYLYFWVSYATIFTRVSFVRPRYKKWGSSKSIQKGVQLTSVLLHQSHKGEHQS